VFDTHHYECYNKLHPNEILKSPEYYIPLILETWKKRNIKPKFHVSEQGAGKCGHHSDYIQILQNYLLDIPTKYSTNIDIMIEAKMKEKAIFKLYKKYKFLSCKIKLFKLKKQQKQKNYLNLK
jgi:UV DNA damage endonuclease